MATVACIFIGRLVTAACLWLCPRIQKDLSEGVQLKSEDVSLSNVLYCIYDVAVVSRCTLNLNKILFTLNLKTLI